MTEAQRVHYQNYQAVRIAKRYIEGKRILTYEEYCRYYPILSFPKSPIGNLKYNKGEQFH